jgi:hypothetical protein
MKQERRFQIQVVLDGGSTMETTFSQALEADESPATRFYMGYGADNAKTRTLSWVVVGDIGYDPRKVMGVRIVPLDSAGVLESKAAAQGVRRLTSLPRPTDKPAERRRRS